MTAVEMEAAMGTFVDGRVNFVTGSAMMEKNRAELYVDDQVGCYILVGVIGNGDGHEIESRSCC